MLKSNMPLVNYAEKHAEKRIDDRLKRYHLKIIKSCAESPEKLNVHFIKKVEVLKADILEVYGNNSIYTKACNKLLSNCEKCPVIKKEEVIKKEKPKE